MTSDQREPFAIGRLILDYLRTFMWPVVVIVVVLVYQSDVRDILRNREVKVAGVFEIGQQVDQIEENAGEELADIRALLEALSNQDPADAETVVADIETKLDSVERNLSQQVEQIKSAQQQNQAEPSSSREIQPLRPATERRIETLERSGFEALLTRDVTAARAAFEAAYARSPDYHNVDEIRKLLQEKEPALSDPDSTAWPQLYRKVLSDLSWGMPKELRPEFRVRTTESYGTSEGD
jgi:DNA-binding transcriptional MerR regulator